jgi:hypothetical protein
MKNTMKAAAAGCAPLLAVLLAVLPAAAADTPPAPRMFKGMQKGQWKADVESSASQSGKSMPSMVICTDNLMQHANPDAKGAPSGCKRTLIRDTEKEAILESQCPDRASTVTIKKRDAKNVDVSIESTGKRGHQSMKIHYSYLGACTAGQGAMSFDKNSDACKKMRADVAKMEPEKRREQSAKVNAMCR